MDEELCASYLELCLKISESSTQDEDFLSVIIFPQLIAPIGILLEKTATSQWKESLSLMVAPYPCSLWTPG